jgi:hypothetical protein
MAARLPVAVAATDLRVITNLGRSNMHHGTLKQGFFSAIAAAIIITVYSPRSSKIKAER